jgi:hypothetical protein
MVSRRTAALFAVVTVAISAAVACGDARALSPRTDEPMLYVVLTPDSLVAPETLLTALLATTATPEHVEFRSAEQFVMRRAVDGAVFDWHGVPPDDIGPDGRPRYVPLGGNYALSEQATSNGLGRADLRPGETYLLDVSTGGRLLLGSTTIPERPAPAIQDGGATRTVVWPRAKGAAMYLLQIDTDTYRDVVVTDTSYVLREDLAPASVPEIPHFRITAVDSNWARYMSDSSVAAAGISGGYGLVGAMVSAEIPIPPRALASFRSVMACPPRNHGSRFILASSAPHRGCVRSGMNRKLPLIP